MVPPPLSSRGRSRPTRGAALALGATLAAGLASASPAHALNFVTNANGDAWGVQDAAIPAVDTGSIRNTSTGSLQGYGGLRVHVNTGKTPSRLDGALMRGFGLTFDGVNRFESKRAVETDGIAVSRKLLINRTDSWARFLDSFTNTTQQPVTIDVAFGGQLGYDTGNNQSSIESTSSGDTAITTADTWVSTSTPLGGAGSFNGPTATVLGSTGVGFTRTGSFLRDPFAVALPSTGDESNHHGYVSRLTLAAGQTKSLVRFVVTGLSERRALTTGATIPAAGSQVSAVKATAASLVTSPSLSDLTTGELCTVANWSSAVISAVPGYSSADCAAVKTEPLAPLAKGAKPATSSPYDVVGKTITELVADMKSGKATSQEITRAYLDRIAAYDLGPWGFRAFITVASDAMEQAKEADIARAKGDSRPLLGVPLAAKDLYDSKDMPTTGGSLVFDGYRPTKDAFQVAKMREAGAILLGKANLAEYATDGHYSPSAYGQVWNAFDISKSPIGSSGGSAVAVATDMVAAAFGSQTGDSLWGPSSAASLVSLRGTDGMQSADGVMPLTYVQDYAGWIAKSIPDLATLLNATAKPNPDDPLTQEADAHRPADWHASLTGDALKGKVIGVPLTAFDDPFGTQGTEDAMRDSFKYFGQAGATVKEIPDPPAAPTSVPGDRGYEGWRQWVLAHPDSNYKDPVQIMRNPLRLPQFRNTTPYTGTGPMSDADLKAFIDYRKEYRARLATWMDANGVDAVVFPGQLSDIHLNDSIQPSFGRRDPQSSASGVPTVIFPAGTNDHGQPINLQLQGKEWDDLELLGYAYAYEQVAKGSRQTTLAPRLDYEAGLTPQPIKIEAAPAPITTPPASVPPAISEANPTAPVTPAPAPVSTPRGKATVVTGSAKVSSRGRYSVTVACGAGAVSCRVQVKVSRGGKSIGSKTVTVSAGKRRTLTFVAPSAIRRSIARGSRVTTKVTLKGVAGTPVGSVKTLKLR